VPERYLGQTLGKYRIESLLGSGGFAWVFKGYDPELEIPVAIKVLKPQFAGDQAVVDRFKREASTAAKLRHPNIIKIYAVGRENDAVYFVMDFLPSGLATRLEASQTLPEDYVLRVGVDVARALGFAHREGVIHRDIKVDNILFDSHGNAIVADFGIARALSGYTNQTGTNMVVGTPQYFAPEQARAKQLDGRADLYSLGVTLFRAATGRLPFEGEDWYEIARQHVEEPAPSPRSINPGLSSEFEAVVLQCMAKSPDDRPGTGELLADAIQAILGTRRDPSSANTLTVPATPIPTGGTPRVTTAPVAKPVSRRRLASSAVVASVVVAGIAALLWLPLGSPANTTNAATDSTKLDSASIGATGSGDSVPVVGPPAPPGGSPPPKATIPGKTNTTSVTGARPTVGSIAVSAAADVQVTIAGQDEGTGNSRRDSLPPGQYLVRAVFPTNIEGCTAATQTRFVNVRAGAVTPISVSPQPCGLLEINVRGRSDGNARTIWFAMQPEGGSRPADTPLSQGAKVFTVGKYKLYVGMPTCQDYSDDLEILAGQTTRPPTIVLFCPEPDRR
jgi:serine/threonine-protein kinase